ncbi:AraC family transcriptional regulator [Saccharophagus degradans]|uniref:AraC family transcriptional regulator n=1 Tax=Saccharophagus degradans TaxID=86304 RepID=UPI001C0A06E4|nr:AraC family transcriptional regulator [Saccharophagus degradans]MBU2986105.1 AraC family transcriptional regulator [Saccharophagus degradans]
MKKWKDVLDIGPQCVERFVDPTRTPELVEADIQLAGVSRLEGAYRVGHVAADIHTVLFSVNGQGLLHTDAGSQAIASPSVTVLPAGLPFLFELDSASWSTAWFCFYNTRQWRALASSAASVEYCEQALQVYHLLSVLYYEPEPSLRLSSMHLLSHYLNETLTQPRVARDDYQRVDTLFRQVENQLHFNWSIEYMCDLVHYSAPHLHRLCRQRFGRSPVQQVIYLRMERAKYLLQHTDWSIAQIGGQVGYTDVLNFSKRFKKSLGQSPGHYRTQSRGEL